MTQLLENSAVAAPDRTSAARDEALFVHDVFEQRHRLQTIAWSILRDAGEAEDAVQETLVKAWKAWSTGSYYQDRFGWAARICVNHCLSTRRRLSTRGFFGRQAIPQTASVPDSQRDPSLLDVDRAYQRLSLKQRAALTLNKYHGYSVEECAELMGCGAGSVRTHIARALATLREELTND